MANIVPLVGFCGSRKLPSRSLRLVAAVVSSVAQADRGIAVGCDKGADAMTLRACFTDTWGLRVPFLRIFAVFGPDGRGEWEGSATPLVQEISRLPLASNAAGNRLRVVINWRAGGSCDLPLDRRLQTRSAAVVAAAEASGEGRGLVAFVTSGPDCSPEVWRTIRLAYQSGLPVVVFGCGTTVRDFPSLGDGHWSTAGGGVWGGGWRWEEETISLGTAIRETIFDLLNWKPARPPRQKVELDFPFFLNVRRWGRQTACEPFPDVQ